MPSGGDLLDDYAVCNSWLQQINNGSLTGIRQSWRATKDCRHHGPLLPTCYDDDELVSVNMVTLLELLTIFRQTKPPLHVTRHLAQLNLVIPS